MTLGNGEKQTDDVRDLAERLPAGVFRQFLLGFPEIDVDHLEGDLLLEQDEAGESGGGRDVGGVQLEDHDG